MTNVEERKAQKVEDATKQLRAVLVPGSMVYTIRRGRVQRFEKKEWTMGEALSVVLITKDGPWEITGLVATILGETRTTKGRLVVYEGGVDPGFYIVYNLSTILFPAGFTCTGLANCPSNEHENGDRVFTDHTHKDGGYALRHQWI